MAGKKKFSEKQWEDYGIAVEELEAEFDNMLRAMNLWMKNAAPITNPENIADMQEFYKEFKDTISETIIQHRLDLKLYD